jgi:hypothetical protein
MMTPSPSKNEELKMWNYIKALIFGQSVERITSDLGSMVERLEAHADDQFDRFTKHVAEAARLNSIANAASNEQDRAKAAAVKIAALFA